MLRRFVSLYSKNGDEDWFSIDIKDNDLADKYSVVNVPFLFVFSTNDQYVHFSKQKYEKLIKRIEGSNPNVSIFTIDDDHFLTNSFDVFYTLVSSFFS